MYHIILNEDSLETIYGTMEKGEIIETVHHEELSEVKRYIKKQYTEDNIKVKWRKV